MFGGRSRTTDNQPFQNSDFQCFQQLHGLPWDCHTLENTGKTEGSWVITVGDCLWILRVTRTPTSRIEYGSGLLRLSAAVWHDVLGGNVPHKM